MAYLYRTWFRVEKLDSPLTRHYGVDGQHMNYVAVPSLANGCPTACDDEVKVAR